MSILQIWREYDLQRDQRWQSKSSTCFPMIPWSFSMPSVTVFGCVARNDPEDDEDVSTIFTQDFPLVLYRMLHGLPERPETVLRCCFILFSTYSPSCSRGTSTSLLPVLRAETCFAHSFVSYCLYAIFLFF